MTFLLFMEWYCWKHNGVSNGSSTLSDVQNSSQALVDEPASQPLPRCCSCNCCSALERNKWWLVAKNEKYSLLFLFCFCENIFIMMVLKIHVVASFPGHTLGMRLDLLHSSSGKPSSSNHSTPARVHPKRQMSHNQRKAFWTRQVSDMQRTD